MDRAKLSNAEISKLQANGKRQRLWDSQIPGFHAVVTPAGHRSFYYRYRWQDQVRDFKLGTFGAITAPQARKLALSAAGDVARGFDIQAKKKSEKLMAARKKRSTLGRFIETDYGPHLLAERKSGEEILRRLKACFGHWYDLPMSEITEWKAKRWRQDELKRGLKPGSVNRPLALLRACLNHAFRSRILESHPLQHLRPLKEDRMGIVRYLSPDEERRLREALDRREIELRAARRRYNLWLVERPRRPPQCRCHQSSDISITCSLLCSWR